MAMRVSWTDDHGAQISFSIRRVRNLAYYNFTTGAFVSSPPASQDIMLPVPEQAAPFQGSFLEILSPTPATTFPDGAYWINIHRGGLVVGTLVDYMVDGDDEFSAQASGSGSGSGSGTGTGTTTEIAYDQVALAVWKYAIETDINAGQALDALLSIMLAIVKGIGTVGVVKVMQPVMDTTAIDPTHLQERINFELDDNGNRSRATFTPNSNL